jgi:HlyD family secretion protein
MSKQKLIVLVASGLFGLASAWASMLLPVSAQQAAPSRGAQPEAKDWQAVAPGRVEPRSEQIRIGSPNAGRVGQVMVWVNENVFAGEALIRVDNDEIRTRFAKVEAEVNLRKRGRANPPLPNDAPRRKVEDSAADAERAVVEAQSVVDRAAAARHAGSGSDDTLKAGAAALSKTREQLRQRQNELARFEARIDLRGAQAALDNLTIRAPIAGTVLQLEARAGELTSPSASQPLVVLGDLSLLRVRAEIDERDVGSIRTGQAVVVRSVGFPGRDFEGTVSSIAKIIGPGSFGARGQSNFTDIDVAEVVVELQASDPLIVGMKVDVYFRRNDTSLDEMVERS